MSAPPLYGNAQAPMQQPLLLNNLKTQVEIHISCKNLQDKDVLSKSDPLAVLFVERNNNGSKSWIEFGRTEVIQNNLNPEFSKSIQIDYNFEEYQKLKFEIYDFDSTSNTLNNHDFLGSIETTLGSIVGEYNGKVTKNLLNRQQKNLNSTITIHAEELNNNKEIVHLDIKGIKLDKKDFFGSSDPFLIFYRHSIEDNHYVSVHKTEVIKNNLNPHWKPFTLQLVTLCNGDKHRPIKIECYDWDSDGSHDLIGVCETTVDEMTRNMSTPMPLINPKKKKKGYKNSGQLQIVNISIESQPSFFEYITGGVEINCHVAIDFTASNGDVNKPTSLHYRNPNGPNQYAGALQSVGQICEDYDTDKLIPAYGFGARINGQVYHNFHLNQTPNPNCYGIQSVVGAYHQFLQRVELYGPTNFSPIINSVASEIIKEKDYTTKYNILLILTDGIITDMDLTKSAIINASKLPLSIIIVGVGNADFDAMDQLDSDNGMLTFNGSAAERDIVQFVPFRQFSGYNAGEALARAVLHEVPGQLVSYMKKQGVKPVQQQPYQQEMTNPQV